MVRKIKAKGSWKNLEAGQFRRIAEIEIDDERNLIFQSLNPIKEKQLISSIIHTVEVPVIERKATKEEKELHEKNHPAVNKAVLREMKVIEYDYTNEDYLATRNEQEGWMQLALELINVDLKQKIGTVELWEDMELESSEDFIGLAKLLFEKLGFGNDFQKKVELAKKQIKGDLISNTILEIENLFKDENSFDMYGIALEMIAKKKLEKEVESNAEGTE